MKVILLLLLVMFSSCATVVNTSNFDPPQTYSSPKNKKSISITVFVKLYDEDGEFYGYGYQPKLTELMVSEFKASGAFTKVAALSSTCSTSYTCLDIPTSKKIRMQRHVNIIMPDIYPKKDFSIWSKALSVVTLGLFPAYYNMEVQWEVNMYNNRREQLYSDDTTYEGKTMSALWLHLRDDKLAPTADTHYDAFYARISKQICKNIIFQLKRFP